jgi:MoaA/NifB/PqqE/SkfB family radical SAM enzyme
LTGDNLFRALNNIVNEISPEFLILFGGEPTLHPQIGELIAHLNRIFPHYTLITNSTRVFGGFEELRGLTCSIDYLDIFPPNDIGRKSSCAKDLLLKAKEVGIPDVCGNIIITSQNFDKVPELVRWLDRHEIWSILGIVHSGSGNWHFRANCPELLLNKEQAEWVSKEMLKMINDGYLIHNVPEYFTLLPHYYDLSWRCSHSQYRYITIDEDGSFIACNDWWGGEEMRRFNILDFNRRQKRELEDAWRRDVSDCPGCFYNHMIQVEYGGRLRHL